MGRYLPVDSFNTGTIAAGATAYFARSFGYSYLNVVKIKVVPSGSTIGWNFKIFKDAAHTEELLATKDNVIGSFFAPTTRSGAEALEGFVVPYEDLDALGNLNIAITNQDSVSRNYDVSITCEVPDIVGGPVSGSTVTATTAFRAANGSSGVPSYSFTSETTLGFYRAAANVIGQAVAGVTPFSWFGTQTRIGSTSGFAWVDTTNAATGTADVILVRDAANVLAQKNGTTAQELRIYGTTTGPVYLSLKEDGTNAFVGTNNSSSVNFITNAQVRWGVTAAGHFNVGIDNTYDIGTSVSSRSRSGYFGTSLIVGTNSRVVGTPFSGVSGTTPATYLDQTDAALDSKIWFTLAAGGLLQFNTANDAVNASASWLKVSRSGINPSLIHFNPDSLDTDLKIGSVSNPTHFNSDANLYSGVGGFGFGAAAAAGAFVYIDHPALSTTAANYGRLVVSNSAAVTIPSGTSFVVATLFLNEPNITLSGGGAATLAATAYISGAPTEGGTNAALYIASGLLYSGGDIRLANNKRLYSDPHAGGASVSLIYEDNSGLIFVGDQSNNNGLAFDAVGGIYINYGQNDVDFRVSTVNTTNALVVDAGLKSGVGSIIFGTTARLKSYTVSTLPAGTTGDMAYVTDALAPAFLAAVVGGGGVTTPVFYNGSNWVGF